MQSFIASTITTVLTTFTSFGLAAVSAWFASERWTFSRHRGQKWLSDVLIEAKDRFWHRPGITWTKRGFLIAGCHLNSVFKGAWRILGAFSLSTCRSTAMDNDDLEAQGLPTNRSQMYDPTKRQTSNATIMSEPPTPTSPLVPPTPLNSPVAQDFDDCAPTPDADNTMTVGKQLWKNAFRNIKMRKAVAPSRQMIDIPDVPVINLPPIKQRTTSSTTLNGFGICEKKKGSTSESVPFSRSRISTLIPKLVEMKITHDLAAHSALVRHMQFSPDGKFLATSR